MFNFFKKNQSKVATTVTLKISGMHCTSCALNIDGALEDTPGVMEAVTSYAQGKTVISFDPTQVTTAQLQAIVREAGYETQLI